MKHIGLIRMNRKHTEDSFEGTCEQETDINRPVWSGFYIVFPSLSGAHHNLWSVWADAIVCF